MSTNTCEKHGESFLTSCSQCDKEKLLGALGVGECTCKHLMVGSCDEYGCLCPVHNRKLHDIDEVVEAVWRIGNRLVTGDREKKAELRELLQFERDAVQRERIICAAVRFQGRVWLGHRHMYALDAMHNELSYTMNRKEMNDARTDRDQGFVTSTGRYVDRVEGWKVAAKAEQIVYREHQTEGFLYSEDLW